MSEHGIVGAIGGFLAGFVGTSMIIGIIVEYALLGIFFAILGGILYLILIGFDAIFGG